MEDKQFEGAPFGTQKARFDVYGVHPDNKLQGSYTEIPYDKRAISGPEARLGPAYYDVDTGDFSARIVAEKASGPGWAREKEMERFAQTPQLFYKEQKQKQKFLEINRGPGKYEVPHFLDLLAKKNIGKRGIFGTREERFKKQQSIISPGPGSYGKGGIPMAVLEEKANKSAGLRGMMDSNSTKSRSLEAMGCELSPNTYKIESGLDKLLRQVVSKRGPYDLFTGERGERIKSGHRATNPLNLSPGMYNIRSFTDSLWSTEKKNQGKFRTAKQYPFPPVERIYFSTANLFRQPVGDYGFYDVKQLSKPENQNPPPFLSSTSRAGHMPVKMLTFNPNNVGVGRYDPTKYDPKSGATYKSCFLSKTQRTLNNLERNKHMEERLRSTNSSNPDEVN
ncbi:lymphocyte expansion molecule-like isoform X1 [Leucoraja erinacea]|uniref:lymphocyte expansion molecule-like isoform X1 n=1 Tax=Leucoraja erinaceus TaxID=7782 RepID=UPI002454643B|nr:lymphocyte expansion molecule-like isoform X1 [Leucoraja erinacea]